MRLSNITQVKLQELADGYKRIGNPMLAGLFEELIDRRDENISEHRQLERGLAYTHASSTIDTNCSPVARLDSNPNCFVLTKCPAEAKDAVAEAVLYLEHRGLLQHADGGTYVLEESEATC